MCNPQSSSSREALGLLWLCCATLLLLNHEQREADPSPGPEAGGAYDDV